MAYFNVSGGILMFNNWLFFIFHFSRQPIDNLTPEERDARTVFCMQLAARIRARDLEDFFSAVGKVRKFWSFHHIKSSKPVCRNDYLNHHCLFAGERCENDLRQKLQEIKRHCIHRVCWGVFCTTGNWIDRPEAFRSAHHCSGLSGYGNLI